MSFDCGCYSHNFCNGMVNLLLRLIWGKRKMDDLEVIIQISSMIHVTISVIFIIYHVWKAQLDLVHELYEE